MVSPQLLLGLGVAAPLLAIGGYVVWLSERVDELEDVVDEERNRAGFEDRE